MSFNTLSSVRSGRTAKFLVGVFVFTFTLSMTVQPLVFSTLAVQPPDDNNFTICHATESEQHPYTEIAVGAIDGGGHFNNNGTPSSGHEEDLLFEGAEVACPTVSSTDLCTNLPFTQLAIPEGYEDPDGDKVCTQVDEPPVDLCSNLDGNQSVIPDGYEDPNQDGVCTEIVEPPVDLCSNLDGNQSVVPDGYTQNEDGTCTQLVVSPSPVPLTVTITNEQGDGEGTVVDDLGQINCDSLVSDSDCMGTYDVGTTVTLTATAKVGSSFEGSWVVGAGTCTGATTPCTVTVTGNQTLTAHFSLAPTPSSSPTPTPNPGCQSNCGGGGGGGGSGFPAPPTPTPTPTPAPTVTPEVLGITTLPATSTTSATSIAISLFSAMMMTGVVMLMIGYGIVPKKLNEYLN